MHDFLIKISEKILTFFNEDKAKKIKNIKDIKLSKIKLKKEQKQSLAVIIISFVIIISWILQFNALDTNDPRNEDLLHCLNQSFFNIFIRPFNIFKAPAITFITMIPILLIFAILLFIFYLQQKLKNHYDPDTVQGSAKWLDDLDEYNMKYTEPFGDVANNGENNFIFSKDIFLAIDAPRRNLNNFIIGGSGAGKSYNYVGPNVMQANCSYVITDPSGGLLKEYGSFLEYYGYKVKVFNLSNMERGNHYNPFNYVHSYKDVGILVTTLIQNTNPPNQKGGDAFWEKSETLLLIALISYLHTVGSKESQNFGNIMKLLRSAEVSEEESNLESPLDLLFEEIRSREPDNYAVAQYDLFKMGAGKTLKSILISCGVRLQPFALDDVKNLTDYDDIGLYSLGDERSALFIILPTGVTTFNFLAAMLYSQLFQRLYDYAETTAEYTQLILDDKNQVVKTFRANSPQEAEIVHEEAKDYFERAKNGRIVKNEQYDWYELRTDVDDELVFWRGSKKLALEEFKSLQNGKVVHNWDRPNANKGQRLPIHLRMLLDEFANIGKIPNFEQMVATMRKYSISVDIILQSLSQMKNMYEKNWSEIAGNCDTSLYLGGGADEESTKWISGLLGKETRSVMSQSFGKSGSISIQKQGVELYSPAELRTLDIDYCIVIPKSLDAYKGEKYMTHNHPRRKLVESLPTYFYDPNKTDYFISNKYKTSVEYYSSPEDDHGDIMSDEAVYEANQATEYYKSDVAEDIKNNEDAEGQKVITSPKDVNDQDNDVNEDIPDPESLEEQAKNMDESMKQKEMFFSSSVYGTEQ